MTPIPPPATALPAPPSGGSLKVGPYTATFTEYPLPAGQTPYDITVGPDGAVWFAVNDGIDRITGSGTVTPFPGTQFGAFFTGIASFAGALWYGAVDFTRIPTAVVVRQGISGPPAGFFGLLPETMEAKFAVSRDGFLWATSYAPPFGSFLSKFDSSGAVVANPALNFDYVPRFIAAGSDGNMYVTAIANTSLVSQSVVFAVSPNGTVFKTYDLPSDSRPYGITAGPDGAMWIAEPGSGQIARIDITTGTITQFGTRAPPWEITKGSDGALWFTQGAGQIGRITTAGEITNYALPDIHAGLWGIASCPQVCDNAHGRLWFTENNARKVGKFEF